MRDGTIALLVHTDSQPMSSLARVLEQLGVVCSHATTCGEAMVALLGNQPPPLVFSDTKVEDGSWAHILALARQSTLPACVIVVSKTFHASLYRDAVEQGAWDLVAPPFEQERIYQILQSAMTDAVLRRTDLAALHRPRVLVSAAC